VKHKKRALKIADLAVIVERSIERLGSSRCLSKNHERYVQTSETLLGHCQFNHRWQLVPG
jgi:hypothetical protein